LVKADPFDLQLVLLNLVQNAGKFVPRGGDVSISLSVVETQLQGSSRVSEPSAVVAVSETAMRPSLLERIFGPTFSTRRLGIGLAIASRIIERTGGRVQIASEPQKEKAIKCSWPLVSEATARVQIATRAWRNAPVARNTVLIVDEERSLRELLKQVFSNYGYHVLEASKASEALGVAKPRGQPIDLLVTDLVMPAMTGVELATKLAAEEPGLRVLFLSGHVSESPGFDHPLESSIDLIDEPIEADVLYRKVEGVITK